MQGTARALVALLLALPAALSAAEARFRLLDNDGNPMPGARVQVLGLSGSVVTGPGGEFRLDPQPRPPFELAVFAESGAWLGLVRVDRLAQAGPVDVRLPSTRSAEVTVQAGAAPSTLAPPANAATLVAREELEERRPSRLTETLEEVPGTWRSDESSSAVPTIRGLSAGRVLLMLDDGRISAERRAGASASYLNPAALENVEVVRGPGSVAYGSDAIGGIVHGKTPLPVPGLFSARYAFSGGVGGVPEASGSVGVNVPVGATAFTVQAQQRHQDDYDTPDGKQENSASRDRGFLVRWLVPLGPTRLWAGFQLDQSRDMGKPTSDQNVQRTTYPREDSRRFTLGLDATDVLGFSAVELRGFLGSYRLVTNRERLPVPGTTRRIQSADVDANDGSLRLLARRAIGKGSLRAGVDVNGRFGLEAIGRTQSYSAAGVPTTLSSEVSVEDASRTDWGAFLEGDVPLVADRLTLTAGLRGDTVRTRNEGGFIGDRSTSHGALSGFATLSLQLPGEWKTSLQYARGFRDALLSDRYFRGISGRGFVTGNPDLEPETTNQLDVSLRGRAGPIGLAAYGYLYRIEDLIERYRPNPNDFAFRNRGEQEIRGVELEADARLLPRLLLRVAGTWARGRILDDGSYAAGIPPVSLSLSVDHAVTEALWYRARVLLVAEDDEPGVTEVAIGGYARVDLSAGWRFSRHLAVSVATRNLLDHSYADSPDELHVTAPGRSAVLSLSGTF